MHKQIRNFLPNIVTRKSLCKYISFTCSTRSLLGFLFTRFQSLVPVLEENLNNTTGKYGHASTLLLTMTTVSDWKVYLRQLLKTKQITPVASHISINTSNPYVAPIEQAPVVNNLCNLFNYISVKSRFVKRCPACEGKGSTNAKCPMG